MWQVATGGRSRTVFRLHPFDRAVAFDDDGARRLACALAEGSLLAGAAVYDLTQRQHAILRTFPVIGHFRYWLANYIVTLRKDVLALSRACGVPHPGLVTADQLELLDDRFGATTVADLFGYGRGFGLPSSGDRAEIRRLMSGADASSP